MATGLLYFVAFPPLDIGALAFVALVPLLLLARRVTRRSAFLFGWLAGTVGIYGLVALSIHEAASRYAPERPLVAWLLALVIPQVYGALYFGVFAWTVRVSAERRRPALAELALLPAAWVACEVARSYIGDGCPWVLLGHSQHARPSVMQIGDLGGVPAISYVVALVNVALALILRGGVPRRQRVSVAAAAAAVLVLVGSYGAVQLRRWERPSGTPLRFALVQGDVPEEWRYGLSHVPATLQRLSELTERAAAQRPNLVVWPENAVSVLVDEQARMVSTAAELIEPDAVLLLGAPRAVRQGHRTLLRNSAFAIDGGGRITGIYDKLRLTPFGETYPLGLSAWIEPAEGGYTPGTDQVLLQLAGHPFGVMICYEAIYADLARRLIGAGASFLVNISNDGWFGAQPSLAQHLHAALFRAVENRRFLLRATNAGFSAVVDPRGIIVAEAPLAEPAVLSGTIVPIATRTLYSRVGDLFGWACVLATILLIAPWRGRRLAKEDRCADQISSPRS